MLRDWSEYCENNLFSIYKSITPDCELIAYKWVADADIDHNDIHAWHDNFYMVRSSNKKIAP
jgi:hypothetical protein